MLKPFTLTAVLLLTLTATADNDRHGVVLPGNGHINTEVLNQRIDLTQDVSQLNLCEVRILRNAFFARHGYPFKDAFIRGVFQTTSWYDSLMWQFDDNPDNFREVSEKEDEPWRDSYYRSINSDQLKTSIQEQAFIRRLQQREKELLSQNFTTAPGQVVNTANVYNIMQLSDCPEKLTRQLGRSGFAIVPAQHNQLFHVYEANDYTNFPNFVTTDLFLQLYHLYFDCTLRDIEEQRLDSLVSLLITHTHAAVGQRLQREKNTRLRDAAEWLQAYLTVAANLQTENSELRNGNLPFTPTGKYAPQTATETAKVNKSENDYSDFLGYTEVKYAYSLYRPRGHYTRSERLQRYFRTMMWLQTVHFGTDNAAQLDRALLLADIVGSDKAIASLYRQITEPLTYLMGQPDNIDIMQVYGVLQKSGLTLSLLLKNKKKLAAVRQQIETIAERQTRIKPKYGRTSPYKINLMPQRYQPDAEVLQEMVDYDTDPTKRATPRGLDIFAAMGVSTAERLLIQELADHSRWDGFLPMMEQMKTRMGQVDWQQTVATQWMKTLLTVSEKDQQMPYFMHTAQWDKKNLNAMLASWAELKHDAILYAKQPMGAECGGAGPPDPVTKGYVEPNVAFWQKAITLLDNTAEVLRRYGLLTEKIENITTDIREEAEMLLHLSEKELAGQRLDDEEYDQVAKVGSTFEYISLDLIRQPDQYLMGWDNVEGPNRSIALVADVYTANADNNPEKSILYEAVGQADEIYVIVEIEGLLYLTRGAVFSYREFTRPIDMQRLNDEEWQEHLKNHPRDGAPQWMDEIVVPLEKMPTPNEEYFYSSGC